MEKREAGRKCLDEVFPFFIEFYVKLEIKTFGLILEFETCALWDEPNIELECQRVPLL